MDADYLKEIEKAREDLCNVIRREKCAHMMLQLAWLDAATYNGRTNTGGPNGSIRNHKFDHHDSPYDLNFALQLCDEVKSKHPNITYADLYQLAGVVAVEVAGGPKIDFVPGRKDSSDFFKKRRLPTLEKGESKFRSYFYRMGLNEKDIMALSGVRDMVEKAHPKFDNSYYVRLLAEDPDKLPENSVDRFLLEEPIFRLYVELYAEEKETFFEEYADSHKKLSELGLKSSEKKDGAPESQGLQQLEEN